MRIENIYIASFSGLKEFSLDLSAGVNIIEGGNECGKSSIAAFIKFILYGAGGRGEFSDKKLYMNFSDASMGGKMTLKCGDKRYSIERYISISNTTAKETYREVCTCIDLDTNSIVFKGQIPGEQLLSVGEDLFVKTAFISQLGEIKTGGCEVGNALENLMFSGDEDMNTKDALKKLGDYRTTLLHKNAGGGIVFTLEQKAAELEARLDTAMKNNSGIIAKEGALLSVRRQIDFDRSEVQKYRTLCDGYELYNAKNHFEILDKLKGKESAAKDRVRTLEEKYSHDGFMPDDKFVHTLKSLDADGGIMRAKADIETLALERAESERDGAQAAHDAALRGVGGEGEYGEISAMISSAVKLNIIGIISLAAAATAGALVYFLNLSPWLYGIGAVFAVLSLILLTVSAVKRKKAKSELAKRGAENAQQLMNAVAAQKSEEKRCAEMLAAAERAYEMQREKAEAADRAALAAIEKLKSEISLSGREVDTQNSEQMADFFSEFESAAQEYRTAKFELEKISDDVARHEKELRAYSRDEIEKALGSMNLSVFENLNIDEHRRRRNFLENQITVLEQKEKDLHGECAALRATIEDSAKLKVALDAVLKELDEKRSRLRAVDMAISAMQSAAQELRVRISPSLAAFAGQFVSAVTGGRYKNILIDNELLMSYESDNRVHAPEYMSAGTRDMTYLGLRLGLVNMIFKNQTPPIVLDETFAHIDDERTRRIFKILSALSQKGQQIIIFTCHPRESEIMDGITPFGKTVL